VRALDTVLVPIHAEGYKFVIIFAIVSLILWIIFPFLGILGGVATVWCVYFFRDPVRVSPKGEGWVVSPADGVVQMIERAPLPKELGLGEVERTRISIFLNVFNVHVNRVPVGGVVTQLHYISGKFFNAVLDKASEENERQLVVVRPPSSPEDGSRDVVFVQIAGLVARRILCYLNYTLW
jgi:phosphatidylserine decarboxylase